MNNNIKSGLLTLFTGGFGDIYSRIMYKKCSGDAMWTSLFCIPPFSLVPSIMHFTDAIKDGNSEDCDKKEIIDPFIILIPIISVFIGIIAKKITDDDGPDAYATKVIHIVGMWALFLVLAAIVRPEKKRKYCDKGEISNSVNLNPYLASIIPCFIALVMPILINFTEDVPVLDTVFYPLREIGKVEGLTVGLLLLIFHVSLNLYEFNNFDKSSCKYSTT